MGVASFGLVGVDAFLTRLSGATRSSSESVKWTVLAFSRGALNGCFLPRLRLPLELDAGSALEEEAGTRGGVAGALNKVTQSYVKYLNTLLLLLWFWVLLFLALAAQALQAHQHCAADEVA